MKKYLVIISLLTTIFTAGLGVDASSFKNIRVLIVDERFPWIPSPDEEVTLIGRLRGKLLLGGVFYKGNIEIYRGQKGLYIINELPLEEYVKSVVASEVTESWSTEALKAQAVVVRTYAVRHMLMNPDGLYHLTSSTLHQIYLGESTNPRIHEAVRATASEIITYKGKPIQALYHSTCGGSTENAVDVFGYRIPYLRAVKNDCSTSPYWRWKRVIDRATLQQLLRIEDILDIRITSLTSTGRVKELSIITSSESHTIPSKDFRRAVGWRRLPSTWFVITRKGSQFIFKGRGYGHGVGMCQWGAQHMSIQGKSYKYILQYYYPGTVITKTLWN